MRSALGLVEVRGYVAAIVSADAALKSSDVHLIGLQKVKSGIITVKLTGDVESVIAAVEAGKSIAKALNNFRTSNVIPGLHEDVYKILPDFIEEVEEEKNIKETKEVIDQKVDFKAMTIEELRQKVRGLKIPNITNKQIKFSKKKYLINIIERFYKGGFK